MFQQFRQIDSAFRLVRGFCAVVILGCFLTCTYALYKTAAVVTASGDKMYILADGKVLEAHAGSRKDNIPVEARDHIRMFHQYFLHSIRMIR